MNRLKEKLLRVTLLLEDIKMDLQEKILNLPDNPDIQRLKGQTGAFVIMSSVMSADKGMNMSPRYYDFKYQYEFLCEIIDHTDPFNLEQKLNEIVSSGVTKHYYDGKEWFGTSTSAFRFHPSVISCLKEVLNEQ